MWRRRRAIRRRSTTAAMGCSWCRGATSVIRDASSQRTYRVAWHWTQKRQARAFPYRPGLCDELWQEMGRLLNDSWASPPNQALHLTGAAILVFQSSKLPQGAPAGELGRSPLRFAPGGTRELSSELLVSPPLRYGEDQEFEQMPLRGTAQLARYADDA